MKREKINLQEESKELHWNSKRNFTFSKSLQDNSNRNHKLLLYIQNFNLILA